MYGILYSRSLLLYCLFDIGVFADYKDAIHFLTRSDKKCWGFEPDCTFEDSFSSDFVHCLKPSHRYKAMSKDDQIRMFWNFGDFGSLRKRAESMAVICDSGNQSNGSFLECSDHLRFCRARNIYFDFKNLNAKNSVRYRSDVIQEGNVGGHCFTHFNRSMLLERADKEKGYLQSWAMELQNFETKPGFNLESHAYCDVIFHRPTVIIKLDAAINMYHHFCDFVNLFATQFLNNTYFGRDIDILWWDTNRHGFVDHQFGIVWRAFSENKPVELISLDGKKVCLRSVIFSLLARQIFGLYYNMPLIDGCERSGLFHVFSHHLLNRLSIVQHGPTLDRIRVTMLVRETQFRRILNANELIDMANTVPGVEARIVSYDSGIPFLDQLRITHNSDIFIGMHGSGLTHLLFLPDWAAILEIYNCGDENCYKDLARLRGVKYWTWRNSDKLTQQDPGRHPDTGEPHKKFTNYSFDVEEFLNILRKMVEYVCRHPAFVAEQRRLRRQNLSANQSGRKNEL